MEKTKPLILLLAFSSVLLAAAFLFQKFKAQDIRHNALPKTIRVETAPVTQKIVSLKFETIGSLASTDNIDVSSELSGQISAIYFKPGAYVNKGTLLIQLDPTILKSELASAKVSLNLSQTNYDRTRELAQRKLVATQALDQALADLGEKQNTLQAKQAQLAKLSLRAPFAGTLGSRHVSVGQYVKVGQPLVHIVANHKLRVEYTIPERYLPRLGTGQKVIVTSEAFPHKYYQGIINYIAPTIDKETRTIALEALIDNSSQQLSDGLFVRIQHKFGERRKCLLIPEESLIPTINGQKVFIIENKKAVPVAVKIGNHFAGMAEVLSGLKAHDMIIVRGQHKLKEGSKVNGIRKGYRK